MLSTSSSISRSAHIYSESQGPRKIANWGCPYSYIRVHKPWKQSISKEINDAESEYMNMAARAVARALIGGGVNIHIFVLCPTNFFWNQLDLKKKSIGHNMKIWIFNPPPPINALATALYGSPRLPIFRCHSEWVKILHIARFCSNSTFKTVILGINEKNIDCVLEESTFIAIQWQKRNSVKI